MCVALEVFKSSGDLNFDENDCTSGGTVSFMLGNVTLLYRINKRVHKCNFEVVKWFLSW